MSVVATQHANVMDVDLKVLQILVFHLLQTCPYVRHAFFLLWTLSFRWLLNWRQWCDWFVHWWQTVQYLILAVSTQTLHLRFCCSNTGKRNLRKQVFDLCYRHLLLSDLPTNCAYLLKLFSKLTYQNSKWINVALSFSILYWKWLVIMHLYLRPEWFAWPFSWQLLAM